MTSQQLRQIFLDYFKNLSHESVPSSSLIPGNDPTLLFTNAGMVQFKDTFLGLEKRDYTKATSVQRCVRAGGKHNDLENVGYTLRHHTFFEMLGNFSFGDYFKREAIEYAWRFLTETLKLPPERLWVTVFRDDHESETIWLKEMKIDPKRFTRCGEKDNFWQMGDTGPCGPCTEIYYDHGPAIAGGPPGSAEQDGDRYVEIWNLVFMQYNRGLHHELAPLPKPCVDTGMGLERLAAVIQGVHDNYEIDIFKALLTNLSQLIDFKDTKDTSMRVIADHIRSTAFLINDGVTPSNEGRGYVLRRIIRRAARHGYKLGQLKPFFYQLTPTLVQVMSEAYPELLKTQKLIEHTIQQEEEQFSKALAKGLKILSHEMEHLNTQEIPGELVFQLYDTYGFPPDITADIAREHSLAIDYTGFNTAMERQREQSQQAQQFYFDHTQKVVLVGKTEFVGYDALTTEAKVVTLLHNNKPVTQLKAGEKGVVVIDQTPFYAESGGQVGDSGFLHFDEGSFKVSDTQKQGDIYLHVGEVLSGVLETKTAVRAEVDIKLRRAIMLNHSATHLLHEALRRILGEHVTQKGSLVEAKRLRFDFSHPKALTLPEINAIEKLINLQIRNNLTSEITKMSPEEAKEKGALALFGERYGKIIRMLRMGDFSTEICGGTHVEHTGEIGLFKIISESASASGIRRIEAVTGEEAFSYILTEEQQLQDVAQQLKTTPDQVIPKLNQLLEEKRELEKELQQLKQQQVKQQIDQLIDQAIPVNQFQVLVATLSGADSETLRISVDQLKNKLKSAIIVLASVQANKVLVVVGVSKDCLAFFTANELIQHVVAPMGGKGGGRPDLAQGGGEKPEILSQALENVLPWVKKRLEL